MYAIRSYYEVEVAKKKLPITFGGEKEIAAFMGWDGLILKDPNVDVVAMAAEYAKRVQGIEKYAS